MDHYNRRKVYLCTGLVQRFPGTTFTNMEGEEGMRRGERIVGMGGKKRRRGERTKLK